jgi:hypothetical protein
MATSSLESEHMALYAGMQELVWLRGMIKNLKCEITAPTPFLVDSQSVKDQRSILLDQRACESGRV